ncbi:DUF1428 domain-containing protein [Devosia sp. YIM 151766]|uniref:DUF1428 domain-containing protein n=1 Tax=Devosia sp. YIM 151766 TaxID=3017325 RepID=UPI00255C3480|nr:DUF1428 domain-containing protein [Devosia sp. YIM 151766]WIY53836.1 DUF1428 domain-containing protein [Devosia sp. YIM 151766]
MTYIDGFMLAVPAANKDKYIAHASTAVDLFKKLGATRLVETWADDVPRGKQTDFYRATKLEEGEVPLFSWVEYPDRATRKKAGEDMMNDPDAQDMSDMPFDAARMIYGGFEVLNDTGAKARPGYVDGMISPVPLANKEAYRAAAQAQAPLLIEQGALRVVDTWGDDVPPGETTDFQRAVAAKADETIGFSFIEWPSRQVRDAAWAILMKDPRIAPDPKIWDASRSIMGGFEPVVDL